MIIDFTELANGEGKRSGMASQQSREATLARLWGYLKGQRGHFSRDY